MKVEIWSEIARPWCGPGSHRLDRAVERFEHSGHVAVVHRSFPLGSGLADEIGLDRDQTRQVLADHA